MPANDYLLPAQAHADQQTLLLLQSQTREAFSRLSPSQQQRYIHYSRTEPKARQDLANILHDAQQSINEKVRTALSSALAEKAGRLIDIDTAKLSTTITEVEPNTLDGVRPGKRTRHESRTLWDAARSNYGFHHGSRWRLGSGDAFVDASQIHEPGLQRPMAVRDFIDVVRAVDPGRIAQQYIEIAFDTALRESLTAHRQQSLEFALLEALRTGEISSADYAHLDADLLRDEHNWSSYCATTPDTQLHIPLFVRRCTEYAGFATFSFFPGRPGGAFRRHHSVEQALEVFKNQLQEGLAQGRGHWLTRTLSVRDQIRLQQWLKVPAVNPQSLNPLGKLLYEAFADKRPAIQRIALVLDSTEPGCSLHQSWSNHSELTLGSDLVADFMPTSEIDHKAWLQGLQYIVSELLELLLIPAPGGVTGLNHLMLTASLGALGYQTLVSIPAFANGQTTEFVQAMADILDLSLNLALQAQGARLSTRRTRQLLNDLHNPCKSIDRQGAPYISWHEKPPTAPDLHLLSDAQMLKALIHPQLPPLDIGTAETLLKVSGVTRSTLNAIHAGKTFVPWQLATLLEHHYQAHERNKLPYREEVSHPRLRQRFSLSRAVTAHLLHEHPALATIGPQTPLSPEQIKAVLDLQVQSRYIEGLAPLTDSQGRGLNDDSESIFCQLLSLQHGWPDDLGIQVYAGYREHGALYRSGQLLRSYGAEAASQFVTLVKIDNGYAGYDRHNNELWPPYPGENSLVSAMLRALDDSQRDTLGIGIHDSILLGSRLVNDGARIETSLREHLLTAPDTYPLSLGRLDYFRLPLALDDVPVDDQGIYRFEQRTYIRHDGATFRVLKDRETSRPDRVVWRIVHPDDPVANDPDNQYISTRPGRSEPITLGTAREWLGVMVAGPGGMRKSGQTLSKLREQVKRQQQEHAQHALAEIVQPDTRIAQLQKRHAVQIKLFSTLRADPSASTQQLQSLLADCTDTLSQLITALASKLEAFERHEPQLLTSPFDLLPLKSTIVAVIADLIDAKRDLITVAQAINEIIYGALDSFSHLYRPLDYRQRCHAELAAMERKLPLAEQIQVLMEKYRLMYSQLDANNKPELTQWLEATEAKTLPSAYFARATIVYFRCCLLTVGDPQSVDTPMLDRQNITELGSLSSQLVLTLDDLRSIPAIEALPRVEAMQHQLETLSSQFRNLREELSEPRELEHLERIIELTQCFEQDAHQLQKQHFDNISSNQQLSRSDTDLIDYEFIPHRPTPGIEQLKPRKLVRIRSRRRELLVSGEVSGEHGDLLKIDDGANGSMKRLYSRQPDGTWAPSEIQPSRSPLRPIAHIERNARDRLGMLENLMTKADQMLRDKYLPIDIVEYLKKQSNNLDDLADELHIQLPEHPLIAPLRTAARVLEQRGLTMQINAYKRKDVLNIAHLRFLIKHAALQVSRPLVREHTGKKQARNFLDIYVIKDGGTGEPLWQAHFHYAARDTPNEQFDAGHLKTLAQAHQGIGYQAAQEQAGKPVTPIWRETLDRDSARLLFALAEVKPG